MSNTASAAVSAAPTRCDVLVIGGGPAGTTVAALLAEKGRHVIMLEKDHHPRFHIGESLLPMNLPILERLGVLEEVHNIGVLKYGAEFNSMYMGNARETFYFRYALNKNHPHAYEIRRSQFDEILFNNALRKGADGRQGVRVTKVEERGDTSLVCAVDEQGNKLTFEASYVVDASGRDTFTTKPLGVKRKNPKHNTAAIFGHFHNVERRPGRDEGNISICWFDHGWFWMIPLKDGAMSVGAVCFPEYLKTRKNSPVEFLWDTIKLCPPVYERMKNATLIDNEARATGNYSYTSDVTSVGRTLLVGDSFAFIDPVFSSGVYTAMNAACIAAEILDECLRDPARMPALFKSYDRRVRQGIGVFSWFIYRFTSPSMHKMFMNPRNYFRVQEAVISVLAGDVFGASPIKWPLRIFKVMYYTTSIFFGAKSLSNFLRRKRNTTVTFTGGTLPEDAV